MFFPGFYSLNVSEKYSIPDDLFFINFDTIFISNMQQFLILSSKSYIDGTHCLERQTSKLVKIFNLYFDFYLLQILTTEG